MGISLGKIAASLIPGVGSAMAGDDAKEAAKEQKKAAQEGARFKYDQTLEQAQFDRRTTGQRADQELTATLGQVALQRKEAHEQTSVEVAALDDKLAAERSMSTIRQTDMARKARFSLSSARAAALDTGFELSGTAADVIRQSATLARLDQLNADYESRLGVRGMQFDRAGLMLRSRFADEAADFTGGEAQKAHDLLLAQARDSLKLTSKWAGKGKALELKYAAINYRVERNTIDTQTAINIGADILGSSSKGFRIASELALI